MFKSPLMNGSAFFIFCSKVVRLTTMMAVPLRRPGAGHSGLGIDQRNLAEDAALADPSQDRFDPVDDLENLHLTGLDDIGQVAFFAFLENPVPGLQGLPLKYGF